MDDGSLQDSAEVFLFLPQVQMVFAAPLHSTHTGWDRQCQDSPTATGLASQRCLNKAMIFKKFRSTTRPESILWPSTFFQKDYELVICSGQVVNVCHSKLENNSLEEYSFIIYNRTLSSLGG